MWSLLQVLLILLIISSKKIESKLTKSENESHELNCIKNLLINNKEIALIINNNSQENFGLQIFNKIPLIRTNNPKILNNLILEKPSTYIIFVNNNNNSTEDLKIILTSLKKCNFYKFALYLIFTENVKIIQKIAELLWEFRLPNFLIISTRTAKVFAIDSLKCGSKINLKNSNLCEKLNLKKQELFNFKSAFINCPLKTIWSRYPPFVYEANQTHGFKGILMDFLASISYGLKRNLTLFNLDDAEYVADISQSYNFEFIIQDLREADLYMGASETRLGEIFDLSPILITDEMVFVGPRPKINYWTHFNNSSPLIIYIVLFLIFFGLIGLFFYLFAKFYAKKNQQFNIISELFLMLFAVILGNSWLMKLPKYFPLRIYLCNLFLSFMILNFFIQGYLISIFSENSFEPPISTLEELINLKLPFKLHELLRNFLLFENDGKLGNALITKILNNSIVIQDGFINMLDDLIKDKNFTTYTLKAILFMRPNIEKTFGFFPRHFIYSCFAMEKNSFKSYYLNEWFARGIESGFLEKFAKFHQFQLALKWNVEIEEQKFVLTRAQIQPIFYLCGIGYFCAFIVFIIEIFSNQYTYQKDL